MSAWKPLQMPSIKPSRCSSSAVTCSRTAALRKNAVMSLALPSGSSPPEKAAGNDDHLCGPDGSGKALDAVCDIGAREVADDELLGVRACLRKRALRVVLAVRAGENGDERLRTHLLDGGGDACLRFMGKALNRAAVPRLCRVDGFGARRRSARQALRWRHCPRRGQWPFPLW